MAADRISKGHIDVLVYAMPEVNKYSELARVMFFK